MNPQIFRHMYRGKVALLAVFVVVVIGEALFYTGMWEKALRRENSEVIESISGRCDKYKGQRYELQTCFKAVFEEITNRFGIDTALAKLNEIKDTNIEFAADCHVYAHKIGEMTYERYRGNPKFSISENTNLCNFGFFHGFMQELASHNQRLDAAREFCIRVLEETKDKHNILNPGIYGSNCDHGMGHGLAYKNAITYWGDEGKIAETSVADCKTLSRVDLRECIVGVYGGIAAMYFELHGYKLVMDKNDPFKLCHTRPKEELVACYDGLIPPLHFTFDLDFDKAAPFVLAIPDRDSALVAMRHLGTMPSHTIVPKTSDYSEMVTQCRKYPTDFHLACLSGFAGSLLHIGSAKDAEERVLAFCSSDLTDEERRTCYAGAAETLQYSSTRESFLSFCERVDEAYEDVCNKFILNPS